MSTSNDISSLSTVKLPPALRDPLAGYTFLRPLPTSGSHEAFVARREDTGELVHIRVYALEQLRGDARLRDRIECRALAARAADHPNLVRGFPSFVSDTDLFLVEEYCEGGELLEAVDRFYRGAAPSPSLSPGAHQQQQPLGSVPLGSVPLGDVRRAALELMHGVRHLHTACGLAHRGIKLESVFFDAAGRVKLGRMGLCAAIPRSSGSGGGGGGEEKEKEKEKAKEEEERSLRLCCASKLYAAPEVVTGQPYSGEAVDVWAVGVVLFAMLTGRFPFEEDAADPELVLERICKADEVLAAHPSLARLQDPMAADLVRGMLRSNPASRLTVDEVIAHPFFNSAPTQKFGDSNGHVSEALQADDV